MRVRTYRLPAPSGHKRHHVQLTGSITRTTQSGTIPSRTVQLSTIASGTVESVRHRSGDLAGPAIRGDGRDFRDGRALVPIQGQATDGYNTHRAAVGHCRHAP